MTCLHLRLTGLQGRIGVLGDMSTSETDWTEGQNNSS